MIDRSGVTDVFRTEWPRLVATLVRDVGDLDLAQDVAQDAFAWMLASSGVPIILLYLGFTGDDGIRDAGEPLSDAEHWSRLMRQHLGELDAEHLSDAETGCGASSFWLLVRSRPALRRTAWKRPPLPGYAGFALSGRS